MRKVRGLTLAKKAKVAKSGGDTEREMDAISDTEHMSEKKKNLKEVLYKYWTGQVNEAEQALVKHTPETEFENESK